MPARDNGTVAQQLLQQKADEAERAAEVIDRDPEEAMAKLEKHVQVDPSAGQLQIGDIFNLFRDLQRTVSAMQERQADQQDQLIKLLTKQTESQGRSKADTQREIEEAAAQQRATLEAWNTEPREPVYLVAELSEEKVAAVHNGEFPVRVFRINGLEYPIAVNAVVDVPASVAAVVRHSQKQKSHRIYRPVQSTESIPRPQEAKFLAGSQEVSVGQAGVAGEGRLVPSAAAYSPDQAQPLDYRYDAYGR